MKNVQIVFSILLLVIVSLPAIAQGTPPTTPIDGGLSVLLVTGGIYGIKKIGDFKRSS